MSSLLPWIVLLAPLSAAAVIQLVLRRSPESSSFVSVLAVLTSFVCSCLIYLQPGLTAPDISWIEIPGVFRIPIGIFLDPPAPTMLLIVTGIGSLIHIYSLGYMREDEGKARFFAGLSLFMFAMLGIVLANNFVMLFIFWELV